MRKPWRQLKNETMTAEDLKKARKLTERDLAGIEMNRLRQKLEVTQEQLANKLHVTQTAVSRLERRPDMLLSTLREFIEALGGEIEIRAVFGNRVLKITHLGRGSSNVRKRENQAKGRRPKAGGLRP
jgi:DNA-binding XRE family transcriptional regulator